LKIIRKVESKKREAESKKDKGALKFEEKPKDEKGAKM